MVNKALLSFLLFCFMAAPALALTQVQANVDRNPVIVGEYFVLNISANDDLNAGMIDTSPLLQDFVVGRTNVGRSTQVINFNATKETRWQILLSPKREGQAIIPSFTIDGVSSQPIVLDVAAQGSQATESVDLFIEAELNTKEAYVGQLLTYKVKLYLAVELQRGVLSAPVIEGAHIKQIGDDADSTEIVNGRRFRVIERTYAVIADLPGELVIEGASFSGDVLVETSRRGGMFGFNESRPMQAQAEQEVILINNPPPSYKGKWFVSDLVMLKDSWPEDDTNFTVGNPITRTISLVASNTDEASMPDIEVVLPEGLKAYPEKPTRQTFVRDNQIVSQYSLTSAIVPTQAGTFTLPEITVPWWNPYLKRQETATLPARTITVVDGAASKSIPEDINSSTINTTAGFWPWLTAVFAMLWLITLVLWRRAVTTPTPITKKPVTEIHKLAELSAIIAHCDRNDTSGAIKAVQAYFTTLLNQPMTLTSICALSPQLDDAMQKLQAGKYSQTNQAIDKDTLIDAIHSYSITKKKQTKAAISSLNPE